MTPQEELLQAIRSAGGRVWLGWMSLLLRAKHGFEGTMKFPQDVLRLTDDQARAALEFLQKVTTPCGCREEAIETLRKERS